MASRRKTAPSMAFKGDLRNLSLFDIFQSLKQNNQTGVLALQRDGVTKKLYFTDGGVRVFLSGGRSRWRLGEVFVRRGFIKQEDVQHLLQEQMRTQRLFGELLIQSGKVPQEEIDRLLIKHAEDELFEIFSWVSGSFAFYDGEEVDLDSNIPLSPVVGEASHLCLEAARRLDEVELIRRKIPDNKSFFLRTGGPDDLPKIEGEDERIVIIYECFDEPNCIDEVRSVAGLSTFEVLRSTYLLLEQDLLRPLGVEELVEQAGNCMQHAKEQRAALMLRQAYDLAPEDRGILGQCVAIARNLHAPELAADLIAGLGAAQVRDGDIESGIQLLEEVLEDKPDHFTALRALQQGYLATKDHELCTETSLRLARLLGKRQELEAAAEACRAGLELAPEGVALRYHLSQFLLRSGRPKDAQIELYSVLDQVSGAKGKRLGSKEFELLKSCYRLLLRINPRDQDAEKGLRALARKRMMAMRMQTLMTRGGIAAAVILVVGSIAWVLRPPSAEDMMLDLLEANAAGDVGRMRTLVAEMRADYPEAPQTMEAGLLLQRRTRVRKTVGAPAAALRTLLAEELKRAQEALRDGERHYIEGLTLLHEFLGKLDDPATAGMRKSFVVEVEDAITRLLERVTEDLSRDRVVISEARSSMKRSLAIDNLKTLEERVGEVRGHKWNTTMKTVRDAADLLKESPWIGKSGKDIQKFLNRVPVEPMPDLDELYYEIRVERLRYEISFAFREARKDGKRLLRDCYFEQARGLYKKAYELADAITDESPRERYMELLEYIARQRILSECKAQIERIDRFRVVLQDVDSLKAPERAHEAFRKLSALVRDNPLVRFDRQWQYPYMVRSVPVGAEVQVNGKTVGHTPMVIMVPINDSTTVTLGRSGFEPTERTLRAHDPDLDGTLELSLVKRREWVEQLDGRIEGTPVIAGDHLIVASRNGQVFVVRRDTGEVEYDVKTGSLSGIAVRPLVINGKVTVFTIDGLAVTFNLEDGKILSRVQVPGAVRVDAARNGDTLYAATSTGRLFALKDGRLVYEQELARAPTTELLYRDGEIFMGTADGEILVHAAEDGKELRRLKAGTHTSFTGGLALHGELIVAGAEDGGVYAFDGKSPKHKWRFHTGGPVRTSPVSSGDYIYVASEDRSIYVLDAAGEMVCEYEVGGSVSRSPLVANGFLYAGTDRGRVYAFDLTGRQAWWTDVLEQELRCPLVAGPQHIYAVTAGSKVVAYGVDKR